MKLTKDDFPKDNQRFMVNDFELNVMIHHLEFEQKYKILEVGCNDTELSNTLHSKGCEAWGVDILFNDPKFKFVRGNFQDVELPSNYFDIVIDISAIHHFGLGNYGDRIDIDADITTAKKIHSLLKQNGLFYISTDRVGKHFEPNVNNYFRTYNIEQFINRIVEPSKFRLEQLKFYIAHKYPLTEIDYFSKDYTGSQMFALLRKE